MDKDTGDHGSDVPTEQEILDAGPLRTIELLRRNRRDILELIDGHIKRLEFCCYKYRAVDGEAAAQVQHDYCDKVAEFQEIQMELKHLLERDHT